MNRIKEAIKDNKIIYSILKPMVDEMRKIHFSIRGILRIIPIFQPENTKELKSFKNKFVGKKCFVVTNGPSLKAEDLELIKDEICFGCNGIYKIFDKTEWRPSFWCITDQDIIDVNLGYIPQEIKLFTTRSAKNYSKKIEQRGNYIYIDDLYLDKHFYKENMDSWWPMSATVAIFMIELAIYMGFKEIVLLGTDCTFKVLNYEHFSKDYGKEENYDALNNRIIDSLAERGMTPQEYDQHLYNMFVDDYLDIKRYADKNGIRIINATRGGALEVYPRMELENCI